MSRETIGTLAKIVSGAQTGADRGAMDAALASGLQIGGWAPSGWVYDVPGKPSVAVEYRPHMRLTSSQTTGMVARLNVQDSDATLLLSFAHELTGNEEFVLRQVKAQRKPCKHLVLPRGRGVVPAEVTSAVWEWLQAMRVNVLHVSGPRESKEPGIQAAAKRVIAGLLNAKHAIWVDEAQDFPVLENWPVDDAMKGNLFRSAFANKGEGIKEALKTGVLRMMCPDCGSREQCPCAFRAYAAGEMAAAKKQIEREDEIRASGKYREGGGPVQGVQGLNLENITQRVSFESSDMLSRLYDKERVLRSAPTPQESFPVEDACRCAREEGDDEYHATWCPVGDTIRCFIADCARATTADEFGDRRRGLIARYYEMDGNGAGGSLHIVLDDDNHE
jgi:hypothetical protein